MSIDSSVIRHCPVCGSSDESQVFRDANIDPQRLDGFAFASRKVPEFMHHRLIICPACDLMYASPMPSPSQLHAAYQGASFDSGEEARCASRTYASHLRRLMPSLPDRTAALDIGTGEGSFLEELLAAGFEQVSGVEPSPAAIATASSTVRRTSAKVYFTRTTLPTIASASSHVSRRLSMCRTRSQSAEAPTGCLSPEGPSSSSAIIAAPCRPRCWGLRRRFSTSSTCNCSRPQVVGVSWPKQVLRISTSGRFGIAIHYIIG